MFQLQPRMVKSSDHIRLPLCSPSVQRFRRTSSGGIEMHMVLRRTFFQRHILYSSRLTMPIRAYSYQSFPTFRFVFESRLKSSSVKIIWTIPKASSFLIEWAVKSWQKSQRRFLSTLFYFFFLQSPTKLFQWFRKESAVSCQVFAGNDG